MFKSIRWNLQLWHGLLLLAVVCIFGGTLYVRLRLARYQSIDADLQANADLLLARLRPGFPMRPRKDGPETRPFDRGGFPAFGPRGGEPDRPDRADGPREMGGPGRRGPESGPSGVPDGAPPRFGDGPPRFGGDGPPRFGGRRGPGPMPWPPADPAILDETQHRLEVPEDLMRRFEAETEGAPYFVLWCAKGEVIRSSGSAPEIASPGARAPTEPPTAAQFQERGQYREAVAAGPFGLRVLVGRSIANVQHELRQLLWLLGFTGLGVMAVGLIGGWLLSARAIRPIRTITTTAQAISASNLSQRIDLSETESELGSLATVLNAMFARLQEAFDRQVRFTADASHELRTPLSIIYSHSELALSRQRSAEEYRNAIETCFRASKRMKSLVDSLLVLARADAGKLDIKREKIDLGQTVEECADLVRPLAAGRHVELHLDMQRTTVVGDGFRIAQVVTNLLTNAINYNREGGRVNVSLRPDGSAAVLEVADTGLGISEEDQKHLFERFYRVDKARSRELGGSGLGLAICKTVVKAHGGTITCSSKLDEGTLFSVRLPRGD